MGNPQGFLNHKRQNSGYRTKENRINDYQEVEKQLSEDERIVQASRCMDCGVPFCHWACPVGNIMPEWQDFIYQGDWQKAIDKLQSTNNFPEFTGRVCPALCEPSCVLSLGDDPVTIRENELSVIEYAFKEGYIKPNPPQQRTEKKVAVIGSGPAGLATADQLNKLGHTVTIFEQDEAVGGLLRFGIPDFKLDKQIIDRRVNILIQEGIEIITNTTVGKDISIKDIQKDYDAVCITTGAKQPRDLPVPGRELKNIHFAMDYLTQQNRPSNPRLTLNNQQETIINAKGKNVLVIGGGDTGSDCVGTANRQGANSVTQIEIMPKPPITRDETMPWPNWPTILKTSSSHQEGCERLWNISSKQFIGKEGTVYKLQAEKVEWSIALPGERPKMTTLPESTFEINADLVLLAMGFTQPVHTGLLDDLKVTYDPRGNVVTNNYQTNIPGIFAAGDVHRGASLVVWAIAEGREAAEAINNYIHNQ